MLNANKNKGKNLNCLKSENFNQMNFSFRTLKSVELNKKEGLRFAGKIALQELLNSVQILKSLNEEPSLEFYFQSYQNNIYFILQNFYTFSYLQLKSNFKEEILFPITPALLDAIPKKQTHPSLLLYQTEHNLYLHPKNSANALVLNHPKNNFYWQWLLNYKPAYCIFIQSKHIKALLDAKLKEQSLLYFIFHRQKLTLCNSFQNPLMSKTLNQKIPNGVLKLPLSHFSKMMQNLSPFDSFLISFENHSSPVKVEVMEKNFTQIFMPFQNGGF